MAHLWNLWGGRDGAADPRLRPWRSAVRESAPAAGSECLICGWQGRAFLGGYHSEEAKCPHCGSIARDRFLYWCWTQRTPYRRADRVLETSPRLKRRYRRMMRRRVDYRCSDLDGTEHKAALTLDLQDIALPDASLDVIITPHVLEHVPHTERALAELHRVLRPGGRMFLQVPMPQGVTAPPAEPEYHGDDTLVYWRFGWDLREKLVKVGFEVSALVTEPMRARVAAGDLDSGYDGPDCDEVDLLRHADPAMLTAVASAEQARRYGFLPDFQFITWDAGRPA
ncbi:MAG TPA: methyltransferase domain-containing protein [Mycobacteriales bacterium]|nr:methyltransferase domain-containing protein [Mycobacteriales bacterium]